MECKTGVTYGHNTMMVSFGISDDENSASGTCHQDFKIENPKIANAIHDDPKMENEDVNQREHE